MFSSASAANDPRPLLSSVSTSLSVDESRPPSYSSETPSVHSGMLGTSGRETKQLPTPHSSVVQPSQSSEMLNGRVAEVSPLAIDPTSEPVAAASTHELQVRC